jgi:hypothetical protein
MTVRPLVAIACLLAAGCTEAPASGRVDASKPAGAEHSYPFAVFTTDPDSRDPRILDWIEADCANVALVALARMPVDDPLLRPDRVVEFDAAGRELRRWHKPYSAEILAIQGDDLYFGASPGGAKGPFRTNPAGEITPAVPLTASLSEQAELVDCPAALAAFPDDMSLVTCYRASDSAGRPLLLAWEAGCP